MTNSNDALRACPFCGDEAFVKREYGRTFVACVSSPRTCPVSPKVASYGDDEAIAAWNRRPSPVAGGDLREAAQALVDFIGSKDMRVYATDLAVRDLVTALNQPAAPVEAVDDDVVALVYAARNFLYEPGWCDGISAESDALDKALDAFSSRIPPEPAAKDQAMASDVTKEIARLLGGDPICNGRVTMDTVEAIAALLGRIDRIKSGAAA